MLPIPSESVCANLTIVNEDENHDHSGVIATKRAIEQIPHHHEDQKKSYSERKLIKRFKPMTSASTFKLRVSYSEKPYISFEGFHFHYSIEKIGIYATSIDDCLAFYHLPQTVRQRSKLGSLMIDTVQCGVDKQQIVQLAIPGKHIPGINQAGAFQINPVMTLNGQHIDRVIMIAMERPEVQKLLNLSHEYTHNFFAEFTSNIHNPACPISDLPTETQQRFIDNYICEGLKCDSDIEQLEKKLLTAKQNPYSRGSQSWSFHNESVLNLEQQLNRQRYLRKVLFRRPFTYPAEQQFAEIAAYSLQFEMLFPGFLEKNFPKLGNSLYEVAIESRNLRKVIHNNVHFCPPYSRPLVSLKELNSKSTLSPLQGNLKKVGSVLKNRVAFFIHKSALPLEIYFSYDAKNEDALLTAIHDGLSVWTLGHGIDYIAAKALGKNVPIILAIGVLAAEITPDLSGASAKLFPEPDLPSPEESKSMDHFGWFAYEAATMNGKGALQVLSWLQGWLRNLNPARIVARLKQWGEEQETKAFCEYMLKNLPSNKKSQSPIESVIAEGLEDYLDDLCMQQTHIFTSSNTTESAKYTIHDEERKQNRFETSVLISEDDVNLLLIDSLTEIEDDTNPETVHEKANDDFYESDDSIVNSLSLEKEKKLSIGQMCQITHIVPYATADGRAGIGLTLASGAQVGLTTSGNNFCVDISAPLENKILSTLSTGVPYALPVVAVLFAIQHVTQKREKKVLSHLKKDQKKVESEIGRTNNHIDLFHDFLNKFDRGLINHEIFLKKVQEIVSDIDRAEAQIEKKGNYAEKQGSSAAAYTYFSQSSILSKLKEDVQTSAHLAIFKQQMQQKLTAELKEKSLTELIASLKEFSDKKLLTSQEQHQQEIILNVILDRAPNELTLENQAQFERMVHCPKGVAIQVCKPVKPSPISSTYYDASTKTSSKRQAERVKNWANRVDETLSAFIKGVESGYSKEEIQRLGTLALAQISRTEKHNFSNESDVNLSTYSIQKGKIKKPDAPDSFVTKASHYYTGYITNVKHLITTTLDAIETIGHETHTQATTLFTHETLDQFKLVAAFNSFNKSLAKLNESDANIEQQDQVFTEMVQISLKIKQWGWKANNDEDQKIQASLDSTLNIHNVYGSYSNYQRAEKIANLEKAKQIFQNPEGKQEEELDAIYTSAIEDAKSLIQLGLNEENISFLIETENPKEVVNALNKEIEDLVEADTRCKGSFASYALEQKRLSMIRKQLATFQQACNKMVFPEGHTLTKEDKKQQKEQADIAMKASEELLKAGVNAEDIKQLTHFDNPLEIADEINQKLRIYQKNYNEQQKLHEYEKLAPIIFSPMTSCFMHVLNDINRFEGHHVHKALAKGLSHFHALAPNILPTLLMLPMSVYYGDGYITQKMLTEKSTNSISQIFTTIRHPKEAYTAAKTLSKKATLFNTVRVLTSISNEIIVASAEKMCSPEVSKKIKICSDFFSSTTDVVSNSMYYANLSYKIHKYVHAGTLVSKLAKVAPGIIGVGMWGLDILETFATDLESAEASNNWGISYNFKKILKEWGPDFRGNLPENKSYYIGKDILHTALLAPIAPPFALIMGGNTLFNTLYGDKYRDDVLMAIILNDRYFSKELRNKEQKIEELKKDNTKVEEERNQALVILEEEIFILKKNKQSSMYNLEYYLNPETPLKEQNNEQLNLLEKEELEAKKNQQLTDLISSLSPITSEYSMNDFHKEITRVNALKLNEENVYCGTYTINKDDSRIVKRARSHFFEYSILQLEETRQFDQLISQTHIHFGSPKTQLHEQSQSKKHITRLGEQDLYDLEQCHFKVSKSDIFETNIVFMRFNAFFEITYLNPASYKYVDSIIQEVNDVEHYFEKKWAQLEKKENPESALAHISNIQKNFTKIKLRVLSNCFRFYLQNQKVYEPLEILSIFDAVAIKKRNVFHWYTLGVILTHFEKNVQENARRESSILKQVEGHNLQAIEKKFQELRVFCYETIISIIAKRKQKGKILSPLEQKLQANIPQLNQEDVAKIHCEGVSSESESFCDIVNNILSPTKVFV